MMSDQFDEAVDRLRAIPISRRGEAGVSFAVARNDEEERTARKEADARGLDHGPPMFFPKE